METCPIIGKYLLGKMDAQVLTNLTSNTEVVEKETQFQCRRSSVSGRRRRTTRSMTKGTYRRGIPRHRRNRPQSNRPNGERNLSAGCMQDMFVRRKPFGTKVG